MFVSDGTGDQRLAFVVSVVVLRGSVRCDVVVPTQNMFNGGAFWGGLRMAAVLQSNNNVKWIGLELVGLGGVGLAWLGLARV